jgi:hypothetical protein
VVLLRLTTSGVLRTGRANRCRGKTDGRTLPRTSESIMGADSRGCGVGLQVVAGGRTRAQ